MTEATITETNATHTRGPWTFHFHDGGAGRIGYVKADNQHREIAVLYNDEQQEANARLIATAPELLAALKALLDDIETGLLVRDVTRDGEPEWSRHMLLFVRRLQSAQAAVAKAEGR